MIHFEAIILAETGKARLVRSMVNERATWFPKSVSKVVRGGEFGKVLFAVDLWWWDRYVSPEFKAVNAEEVDNDRAR